jgi:hypothetical protein
MLSVKYKIDSLMVLRALQVVLTTDIINLGIWLECAGIMGASFTPSLLALAEFGLLIIVWARRHSWRVGVNLYAIFMICVEIFWIFTLLAPMPYLLELTTLVLLLNIIRVVVLIRFDYVEGKKPVNKIALCLNAS